MAKMIVSLRVHDFGEYHNTLVKLYVQKDDDQEGLFIRYGYYDRDKAFLPCSAMLVNGKVNLHKAGVGKLGDIKIEPAEWLKALKVMRSAELLQKWNELINNKKAA